VALPASAAARRPLARAAAAPAVQQSIDIHYPPGTQQQTRRTLLQRANGTDRRTDGHRTVTWTLLRILRGQSSANKALPYNSI